MTWLVSAIGLAALLAALAGTVLLDLARESDGGAGRGRLARTLAATAADGRAVRILVVGLVLLGAACTVVRLGLLA